jgi:hypothetical protein
MKEWAHGLSLPIGWNPPPNDAYGEVTIDHRGVQVEFRFPRE